ncbi:uncharacterized protein LOC142974153 [Anticarsia gemmatalis]|uniref:uncharacterized protein LOC142974153 n=1 Tax=Anticarsia gemmatalis TaxID=129554 RepID=UPI003F765A37
MADEVPPGTETETTEGDNVPEAGDADESKTAEDTKEGTEVGEGEKVEGEGVEGEHVEGEHVGGEQTEGEQTETEGEERVMGEGEELMGEGLEGEEQEQKKEEAPVEEVVEEEEGYVEEPPPDPAAPFDFSDSKELLREPFELRPDQVAEVEQLWELYQTYTPAYTEIDGYITQKELIYMLKCLLLMTYTPEQLEELIAFVVRPPHPKGHITYEQFLKMVTLRQRDFNVEEELRQALQLLDPDKTGSMDREYFREVVGKMGNKMPQKQLDYLIKEVDISNDGTIGIDDVVGTMGIDLNMDDIIMLRNAINPPEIVPQDDDV